MGKTPEVIDRMTPRAPEASRGNTRDPMTMNAPDGKAYQRNPVSVFPGVNWYKDFLLYTNYFGINSSAWSGRTGVDLMFEHDYKDQYRGKFDIAYNPWEFLDLYAGYE